MFAGGFGGTRPIGSGLLGFAAAPRSAAPFGGGSSTKAFGAPAHEDEGDSEDDDDDESEDEAATDRPKDRRFDRMSQYLPLRISISASSC